MELLGTAAFHLTCSEGNQKDKIHTHTLAHRNHEVCWGNIREKLEEITFLQQCFSVFGYLQ